MNVTRNKEQLIYFVKNVLFCQHSQLIAHVYNLSSIARNEQKIEKKRRVFSSANCALGIKTDNCFFVSGS